MTEKERQIIKDLELSLLELDTYCANDCSNSWACAGCPIQKSKKILTLSQAGIYLDGLNKPLDQEQNQDISNPCHHLSVIQGGRIH